MARIWAGVRHSAIVGAVLVHIGLVASAARPHAVIAKATLAEKPIVANDAATPVTIHFNSRIEPGFTRVRLVDETKRERSLDVTSGRKGDTVMVHLPALPPGMYALRYKVLSVDGHVTEGTLRFHVQPAP